MKKISLLLGFILAVSLHTISAQPFDFHKDDFLVDFHKLKQKTPEKVNTIIFDQIGYYLTSNWKENASFFEKNQQNDSILLNLSFVIPKKEKKASTVNIQASGLDISLKEEIVSLIQQLDFTPYRNRLLSSGELTFKDSLLFLKPKENYDLPFVFKPKGTPKSFVNLGLYTNGKPIVSQQEFRSYIQKRAIKLSKKSLSSKRLKESKAEGLIKLFVSFNILGDGTTEVVGVKGNNIILADFLQEDLNNQKLLRQGLSYFGHKIKAFYELPVVLKLASMKTL